jgi:hypothetical protein
MICFPSNATLAFRYNTLRPKRNGVDCEVIVKAVNVHLTVEKYIVD